MRTKTQRWEVEGIKEKGWGPDGHVARVITIQKGYCISAKKFLGSVEVQGNSKVSFL